MGTQSERSRLGHAAFSGKRPTQDSFYRYHRRIPPVDPWGHARVGEHANRLPDQPQIWILASSGTAASEELLRNFDPLPDAIREQASWGRLPSDPGGNYIDEWQHTAAYEAYARHRVDYMQRLGGWPAGAPARSEGN
jgi:hypothetical protein